MIVAAAALVCLLFAFAAFGLLARGRQAERALARHAYLGMAAVALGCGLWGAHAIALEAFLSKMPESPVFARSATSAAIAIAAAWLGLGLALWRPASAINGGAIVAGAACAVHFVGIAAVPLAGATEWDTALIAVSVIVGSILGATALSTVTRSPTARHRGRGAVLMALAVVTVHFTAVAAASRVSFPVPRGAIDYAAPSDARPCFARTPAVEKSIRPA